MALQMVFVTLPYVVLAPWAGRLAQRVEPRHLMMAADLWRAGLVLVYPWCTTALQVFALNALRAAGGAFWEPARGMLIRASVDRKELLAANSLGRTVGALANLIGPAVAGVIVEQAGTSAAFYVNAISFLVSAWCLSQSQPVMRLGLLHHAGGLRLAGWAAGPGGPARLIWQNLRLREVALLTALYTAGAGAVNAAFYPYAYRVLGTGAGGLGLILSVYLGANLLGAAAAARFGRDEAGKVMFRLSIGLLAIIWAVYGLARSLGLVLLLCVPDGLLAAAVGIIFATALQEEAETAQVGGLVAFTGGVNAACQMAGMVAGGYLSDVLGADRVFLVVGAGYAVLSAVAGYAVSRRR